MFSLLPNLQAWQVRESQLQLVLLLKILNNTAIIRVTILYSEGKPGERERERGREGGRGRGIGKEGERVSIYMYMYIVHAL